MTSGRLQHDLVGQSVLWRAYAVPHLLVLASRRGVERGSGSQSQSFVRPTFDIFLAIPDSHSALKTTEPAIAAVRMTRQNAVAVPPLPSLAPFLAQLGSLVSSPFCPPSLFLHDPRQSPILVEAILQLLDACQASEIPARDEGEAPQVGDLLPTVARLDLAQVYSVKQALDHILAQFSGSELAAQSTARWDDRTLGVRAWDATPLEALCVVKEAPSLSKKRGSDASTSSKRKRRRMRRGEASVSDESGEEARSDDDQAGDEPTGTGEAACPTSGWTLSWDMSQSEVGEEPARSVAPLRNSLDAFHEALRTIFAFADAHTSPIDKDRLPRRRFIILEHGELLGELAGAGKASGAARETGVGVTFASTIHRLAELVSLPKSVFTYRLC